MAYTKDKFFNDIKEMNENNDKYEDKAFESIVSNLFLQNKWGKEKAMGLDEYDSESNSKLTLIPGHIYAFKYMATHTTKYDDGKIKFEYSDTLPLIKPLNLSVPRTTEPFVSKPVALPLT